LEGLSRTILAGSLKTQQEVGVVLHVYFHALLRWGLWEEVIFDQGGQFISHDFQRVNKRLGIRHEMYEKCVGVEDLSLNLRETERLGLGGRGVSRAYLPNPRLFRTRR
jgi:hypothetical protein